MGVDSAGAGVGGGNAGVGVGGAGVVGAVIGLVQAPRIGNSAISRIAIIRVIHIPELSLLAQSLVFYLTFVNTSNLLAQVVSERWQGCTGAIPGQG